MLLASVSFTTAALTYDAYVTLPGTALYMGRTVGMVCVLPPKGNGTLRGVTALGS
jgi:hypothetical protein